MKETLLLLLTCCLALASTAQSTYNDLNKNGRMDPYENPSLDIDHRVDDLLSRMTLEEKVGQLRMVMAWEFYDGSMGRYQLTSSFQKAVEEGLIGSCWALMRADPWTKKGLDNGVSAQAALLLTNEMQLYVREHTRLGIPLLFAEECPHGLMALQSTVFPTALGRAASFNVDLEYAIGRRVGLETCRQGAHVAFGPVVDLARDPRWSRMEEGYGEDPVLAADMGCAYALGLQSNHLISTMKHFAAYGVSEGGHNGNTAQVGNRELLSVLSLPFMRAARHGVRSMMTSYNDVDGLPCSANEWLLKDVLRQTWHFKGLLISDLYAINGLVSSRMAADYTEAAALAARAGVNVDLGASCYGKPLCQAVKNGMVSEIEIDELLKPVLMVKFELGLFDDSFSKIADFEDGADDALALQSARESVVLLKNEHQLLPLSDKVKRIAVIGPNADNVYNMLGDYTAPQQPESVITVLEGIRQIAPHAEVLYEKACGIREYDLAELAKAAQTAKEADVIVAVLGGSSARDFHTLFQQTGAAETTGTNESDMECGEGFDRASLKMMGMQDALLRMLCATGKPVVLVMVQGRPLDLSWAQENVPAVLTAWYPGSQGGRAIAEILFGKVNPSGKLPVSYPRNAGQLPVYYNTVDNRHDYTDMSAQPLYPFGYGLSYTRFEYTKMQPPVVLPDSTIEVSFQLTNIGDCDGAEVVQLYLRDEHASVKLPERQLKQFKKVFLKKNEQQTVIFRLKQEDLALMNAKLEWVVEPGRFSILIGSSSQDIRLESNVLWPE